MTPPTPRHPAAALALGARQEVGVPWSRRPRARWPRSLADNSAHSPTPRHCTRLRSVSGSRGSTVSTSRELGWRPALQRARYCAPCHLTPQHPAVGLASGAHQEVGVTTDFKQPMEVGLGIYPVGISRTCTHFPPSSPALAWRILVYTAPGRTHATFLHS
ncbi:hypothetical protein DFH09DRAFT_1145506 [Mycena vulgaris]|nr:hypothetical protein DFH09DRAFT_1145506 [Mycena vulgaris]